MTTTQTLENTYAALPAIFHTPHTPTANRNYKVVLHNGALADALGLNLDPAVLSGVQIPDGAMPIAQAYAGYQFGHFSILGDGRAVLLGEFVAPDGKRYDVQLKGAGATRYARGGDGLAALGPMLREYVISEFMAAVGIPTTRSLAVVATGVPVYRQKPLQGAVLTRIASSHIRIGTFNFAEAQGSLSDLKALADYTISRHFGHLEASASPYLGLLREVCAQQAELVAKWMLVGFVHGVMNTDNAAISGETIDYGPCAFLDAYDPATVFSSIDAHGRYSYQNQPKMAAWNLCRLAESLMPLISVDRDEAARLANEEIKLYHQIYDNYLIDGMRGKMGLVDSRAGDAALAQELLDIMAAHKMDYTATFQSFNQPQLASWRGKWHDRLAQSGQTADDAQAVMRRHNPATIPRNHHVEHALAAAEAGDMQPINRLVAALNDPYAPSEFAKPGVGKYVTFCGT